MDRDDSTGPDILQDSALADSFLVSAATRLRRVSNQFGWPILLLFLIGPIHRWTFAEAWPVILLAGLPAAGLGLWLRLWSRGFQRREGFVLDGPYRYVRNPVELGAVLGYAGAGAALGVRGWYLGSCCCVAVLYLSFVSISYERELYLRLGSVYLRYAQRVRRWIPLRFPGTNRSNLTYSFGEAFYHERETLWWLAGYVLVFSLRRNFSF